MTNNERLKEIELEIKKLKKKAEDLRKKEKEVLDNHWLVKKMADLGFKRNQLQISCYDENIYYLGFINTDSIEAHFYGNPDLSELYFYEVIYENYSTGDNYEINEFLEIQKEVEEILNDIDIARKILHKEFNLIEDASEDFNYFVDKWSEIIENENKKEAK